MADVYTCTMNPAIDLFIETDTLTPHTVNRALDDDIQANGKGVNVSLILKKLGIASTAIGFSGGFTGRHIQEHLADEGIRTNFIAVEGMTRINVFTWVNKENTEYKLVSKGPTVAEEEISALLAIIGAIGPGDFLCVSGSLPPGVSETILTEISKISAEKRFHLIIDSGYRSVLDCLRYAPYLLKPNEEELTAWFGKERGEPSVKRNSALLDELLKKGAQRILLSLGSKGCIYKDPTNFIYGNAPHGEVVNTACSGDSLLAAFLYGILENKPLPETLKHSLAVGSSTAFSKGLTDLSDIGPLEKQVCVEEIKEEKWEVIN